MKLAAAALAITLLAQAPTAQELRARLNAYLTDYEPKLSELIADEVMIQQNVQGTRTAGGGIGPPGFRTIQSEVAFIALPGEVGWMGFRRVTKVGSTLVEDELGALTAGWPADRRTTTRERAPCWPIARGSTWAHHARSIFPTSRWNCSTPAMRPAFRCASPARNTSAGRTPRKLVFVEEVAPTIIRAGDGSQMRSIVSAFVEPGTGRLWRADVITRDPSQGGFAFDAVISVEFRYDQKLEMLVPARMHEEFFAGANRRGWGDATYSNYRRFQTAARIGTAELTRRSFPDQRLRDPPVRIRNDSVSCALSGESS